MKKYLWILLIVGVLVVAGFAYFYTPDPSSDSNSDYSAERSGLNNTSNTNTNNNRDTKAQNDNINLNISNSTNNSKTTVETEIASYSTVIKNKRDTNRQGNISITCSSLNNTIVKDGDIFSFCDTVGESTIDRGYKEANVIIQGVETKGLGGGNCQVSSTLYNAVLSVPNELEVVERHPHSAPVPYIEEGKDAAVSYGAHDFRFKNNSGSAIKIVAENTTDSITIKLLKVEKR